MQHRRWGQPLALLPACSQAPHSASHPAHSQNPQPMPSTSTVSVVDFHSMERASLRTTAFRSCRSLAEPCRLPVLRSPAAPTSPAPAAPPLTPAAPTAPTPAAPTPVEMRHFHWPRLYLECYFPCSSHCSLLHSHPIPGLAPLLPLLSASPTPSATGALASGPCPITCRFPEGLGPDLELLVSDRPAEMTPPGWALSACSKA